MPYIGEAISVTARFAFWFLLLPFWLAPARLGPARRLILGFLIAASGTVLLVEWLSLLRIYEPISVWILGASFSAAGIRRMLARRDSLDRWIRSLDWMDDRKWHLVPLAMQFLKRRWERGRTAWSDRLRRPAFPVWLLGAGVLSWSAALRFLPYLQHAWLGVPDGYVHLAWMKHLEQQRIFADGVYPYGYHAFWSALGTLTFLDRVTIIRFAGPIAGVLLVLSVAGAAELLRLRPAATVAATALFGLGSAYLLPTEAFRQSQPLPQEFAAMLLLPGVAGAWRFLRFEEREGAWIAVAATFLTGAVYPSALPDLALALTFLAAFGWIARAIHPARTRRLYLWCGLATVLAGLPIGVGRLTGKPMYVFPPTAGVQVGEGAFWAGGILPAVLLAVLLAAIGLLSRRREDRDRAPLLLSVSLGLALYTALVAGQASSPLVNLGRSALFLALFLALSLALALDWTMERLRLAPGIQAAVTAALIAVQMLAWWPVPGRGEVQQEYDEAVDAYLKISREFRRGKWSIVSPTEQFSQVLNAGWHIEAWQFARDLDAGRVAAPDFTLRSLLLTREIAPDVFVYVEKRPLGIPEPVQPDAGDPLDTGVLTEETVRQNLYRNPAGRAKLEARLRGIMDAYRSAHPDQVSIYYDTPRMRVYHIRVSRAGGVRE